MLVKGSVATSEELIARLTKSNKLLEDTRAEVASLKRELSVRSQGRRIRIMLL